MSLLRYKCMQVHIHKCISSQQHLIYFTNSIKTNNPGRLSSRIAKKLSNYNITLVKKVLVVSYSHVMILLNQSYIVNHHCQQLFLRFYNRTQASLQSSDFGQHQRANQAGCFIYRTTLRYSTYSRKPSPSREKAMKINYRRKSGVLFKKGESQSILYP